MGKGFNNSIADSQTILVEPLSPQKYGIDKYADSEKSLLERNRDFWERDSDGMVYRRMRVAEVFSFVSNDMNNSLELQLGALQKAWDIKQIYQLFIVVVWDY